MAQVNTFTSPCPTDCSTDVVFPAYTVDPDCLIGGIHNSEIGDLILQPEGAPSPFAEAFTEGATLSVTAGAVDNAGVDNTTSRRLRGRGSIGEFEDVTVPAPYGETYIRERVAPFEYVISQVNDANRTFAKTLDCRPKNMTAYFGTEDHMFGKDGGVKLRNLTVQMPLPTEGTQQIIIRAEVVSLSGQLIRAANNPFV